VQVSHARIPLNAVSNSNRYALFSRTVAQFTVSVTVVLVDMVPDVAVTVNGYVPGGGPVAPEDEQLSTNANDANNSSIGIAVAHRPVR
jgi:hypothetical protein